MALVFYEKMVCRARDGYGGVYLRGDHLIHRVNRTDRPAWLAEAGPLAVVLIWGLNFSVMKAVLTVMHPHAMNVVRISFSALALAILHARVIRRTGTGFWDSFAIDRRRQVLVGLLGYFLYQAAFIVGLNHTTAGSGALLMSSAPIWTALIAMATGEEHLRRLAWVGLAVSVAGTVMVVIAGGSEIRFGADALFGNVVLLFGALFWGAYTALNRPLVARIHAVSLTFFAALVSLVPLFVVGIPYLVETDWSLVTPFYWLLIIGSGALSSGLATVFWNNAVHTLGASHTAAYGNAVPVVAVAGSALLLAEPVSLAQLVGGLLIIFGLLVMRKARQNQRS